jgi:hypothetical protein
MDKSIPSFFIAIGNKTLKSMGVNDINIWAKISCIVNIHE